MSLNRIACPECGATLKSSAGFTVGQRASCPKCETEFTVQAPPPATERDDQDYEPPTGKKKRADEDGSERSYKNSTLRYVILEILIVVMCVLGYMLYEKKQEERKNSHRGTPATRPAV